jgi:hypothetical protein
MAEAAGEPGGGSGVNVADLVAFTRQQLGKPYVFGATGPSTFDCSGLMQFVFNHFGIHLPRLSYDQATVGSEVAKGSQKAGDLVTSDWGDGPNSHVSLYIGNGQVIEAPQPGENVMISNLDSGYMAHVNHIRRVTGLTGTGATGSTTGSGTSLSGLVGDALGLAQGLQGSGLVGAVQSIGKGVGQIATDADDAGNLAKMLTKLALPNNMLRIGAGLFGALFIVFGLWHLGKEVRDG